MTINGVEWNLKKSPFKVYINDTIYVFSSKLHHDKFLDKLQQNRDIINYSLYRRFGVDCDVSELADFILYCKIESRGFLIVKDGETVECRDSVKLNGVIKTLTS